MRRLETIIIISEEIRRTLYLHQLYKFNKLHGDCSITEELLRSDCETHKQDVNNLNTKMIVEDWKITEH